MTPEFLTLDQVLVIHENQIKLYGGESGLRDMGLLQSALAMPSSGYGEEYFHKDLYEMAAAYLFHFVKNHPFVDGNKRVGLVAAYVFLRLNGIVLTADNEAAEKITLETAQGKTEKPALAAFFKKHSRKSRKR
ncbi:MAG TPA: type II toxin-antitoxin system death-on-curing family toxin [bacterium]|nr:type II toxin-antitoxin system death-on-curing family toxin [bacterium]